MWHDDSAFKSTQLLVNSHMDLSAIYSKTPKGLRARASLIGGLSSHLMKVLTHVDGNSKAETILLKFDNLTPQQLGSDLKRLEQEGYIRLATVTAASDDGWALTTNFTPMVVEEYQNEAELEATAKQQTEAQARLAAEKEIKEQEARRLAAEQIAKQEEDRQLAEALKAEKKAQKLRDKEKIKAQTKVNAQLEQERIAEEKAKAAEAARLKAEAEAQLKAQQQAAERAAKLEEETRQKAELKAREMAEQAQEDAEIAAKESARREIERISRVAEEAQNKADAELKAKQEAEREAALSLAKANEQARLQAAELAKAEAEQAKLKVKADAEALQAKIQATAEAELQSIQAREQAKAEAKAQEVAAEKALQEEKAQQAAKEKAHLDIASVLRKAEEDRKNAAALAKAEKIEAKRQAKAEQEARTQAERKAKDDAKELAKQIKLEEKAKLEAAENAKREMARIAKEAEIARALAEQEAKQESKQVAESSEILAFKPSTTQTEVETGVESIGYENIGLEHSQTVQVARAKLTAEEQANKKAKENARLEMERIGREADLARQKSTVEQHLDQTKKNLPSKDLPILDDFDAAEAAEEAAFQAEEQAQEQHAAKTEKQTQPTLYKIEKTAQQATEDAGRVDIKNAAIAEAKALASMHTSRKSNISTKKIKQWLTPIAKGTLIYLPVLLLILVALAHFINLSALVKPIQQLASNSIGEPVAIQKVYASLWPQPHLVLQDVTIGSSNNIKAIHVLPVASSLFEQVKEVKSLVVEGLTLEQANFGQPLQWASNINTAKNLKVAQINLKNLTLVIRDLQLGTFDGKVTLTDTAKLGAIELVSSNNALSVKITPKVNDYEIALKAANWGLPFNQKIIFSTLNVKGIASENQLVFSQIEGEIFGGNLTASANIQWPNDANKWQSSGNYKLANASAEQLLNTFSSEVQIDGKLNLSGNFSNKAATASQLSETSIISANFDVRQGGIKGIELARAVLNRNGQSLAGNTTSFDALTGTFNANKGQYQFTKLQLSSPQFRASGFVKVAKNQAVSGRLNADLDAQSRRLQANFGLIGRGKDLKSN